MHTPGEQPSQEQGPGLLPPTLRPPGNTGCLPPSSQELMESVNTHIPELAGSVRGELSAWDISTSLLHPIYISSCSCPFPFS